MNIFSAKALLVGSALILTQGCAHGTLQKQLDEKLSQETTIKSQAGLRTEGNQVLASDSGLSDTQRSQLQSLREETRNQLDDIWSQSLKLRSILVKDLITVNYDEDEVELVKTRLRALEEKRLSAIFSAIDKANSILGRQAVQNKRIVDDLFERGGSRIN